MQIGGGRGCPLPLIRGTAGIFASSRMACTSEHSPELPFRLVQAASYNVAYEVPRLQHRNDCYDAGGPLRRTGRHRCVRRLPGVLVRSDGKPAALCRLHTEAHEVYRRTLVTGEAIAAGRA